MSARAVAQSVLVRVLADRAFADRALDTALSRAALDERDRGLVTELVYGTLRQQSKLDFYLQNLAQKPLAKLPDDVLVALRLGAYQLLHMRVPAHGAVNESVALVRQKHLRGVVNAILRRLAEQHERGALPAPQGDELTRMAVRTAHPRWLLASLQPALDGELEAWAEANNQPAPLCLRTNRTKTSREQVLALVPGSSPHPEADQAVLVDGGRPSELPGFREGLYTVQDAAAQLVGALAAPERGAFVLDLCAAPGGKTTHLAEQLEGTGMVLAVEKHPGKTRLIEDNAARLGLRNIVTKTADARDVDTLRALLAEHGRKDADLVVLDAPCSGFGTLRKHPELKNRREEEIAGLVVLQRELLEASASVVRPGGALVYSVCTIIESEGAALVRAFLDEHPDYALAQELRTFTHRAAMDGFYAARLTRALT